ncbi:MAG: DUF4139 domain-containing protein [Proteobacteria bacterium]|nr:DUF4139 domain-containing protein [Pseudomonadota bacterium]
MARPALLAILFAVLAGPALGADIASPKADAVAVTIYRDGPADTERLRDVEADDTQGLAMVVEQRSVDLPAGRSRVKFQGVADGIIPESAAVEGLPGAVVERDFDYDLLGPGAILKRFVGRSVRIVRTNPKTGKATEETAILRSGPGGIVLDIAGRIEALHCSGGPEKLVFDEVPADLADKPTLSALVDVPAAGRYTVRVSYLTVRLDWSADYVARMSRDGRSLALSGWITLANRSSMNFANAPTAVVAGNLSRVEVELPEVSTPTVDLECWPLGTTHDARALAAAMPPPPPPPPMVMMAPAMAARAEVSDLVVTAARRVEETRLGDYHLYTLAEPTTVAARQTKQIQFLDQPSVKFEKVYVHQVYVDALDSDQASDPMPTEIQLRSENKADHGLGRGLPAGRLQIRAPGPDGREGYAGSCPLERDVAVGEPIEIKCGAASAVLVTQRAVKATESRRGERTHRHVEIEVTVTNAKDEPATVEIRHMRDGAVALRVSGESARHGLKSGDPNWRFDVGANAEQTLTYAVDYDVPN